MKEFKITRLKACRFTARLFCHKSPMVVAFVCRDEDHRRMINEYFATVWGEIPEWMKPELMVRNTRQFKFAGGSMIRLVLRPDFLKGGTYDAVFTHGPTSDVAALLSIPENVITQLFD